MLSFFMNRVFKINGAVIALSLLSVLSGLHEGYAMQNRPNAASLKRDFLVNEWVHEALYDAAKRGKTLKISELLMDPRIDAQSLTVALSVAARNGNAEVVRQLLAHPDVDVGRIGFVQRTAGDKNQNEILQILKNPAKWLPPETMSNPRVATREEHLEVRKALSEGLSDQTTLEPFEKNADLVAHIHEGQNGKVVHAVNLKDTKRIQSQYSTELKSSGRLIKPAGCPTCRHAYDFFLSTGEHRSSLGSHASTATASSSKAPSSPQSPRLNHAAASPRKEH